MNATTQREYRKQRAKGLPAHVALAVARTYERDYGWEPAGRSYDRWTKTVDGFELILSTETESCMAKDDEGMGHYVQTRHDYTGWGEPSLSEDTPLGLPAAHFVYATGSRDSYGAFFPDAVEGMFEWYRTGGGMSRGVARETIAEWVTRLVRECCSEDYVYMTICIKAERQGVELARACIGNCDFINPREEDIFAMAEDYGLADEALDDARVTLKDLCSSK